MATCLLLTVRAANFLSLMSRKHAWNRCLMEWKWLHCPHTPRPPNREPGSMRKKEKKRRGRRRWDTRDMLTGNNDLVDTTVDVDEYNTPRLLILISAVIADRSAALAPSTVLAHPHLTEDSCLLRAACLSAASKYRGFSSPSRGNSKQGE